MLLYEYIINTEYIFYNAQFTVSTINLCVATILSVVRMWQTTNKNRHTERERKRKRETNIITVQPKVLHKFSMQILVGTCATVIIIKKNKKKKRINKQANLNKFVIFYFVRIHYADYLYNIVAAFTHSLCMHHIFMCNNMQMLV